MTGTVIFGVHSDARVDESRIGDGHGWISVMREGVTETYGAWPKTSQFVQDYGEEKGWNGQGTSIQKDIELKTGREPAHSHYFELTPDQEKVLEQKLNEPHQWKTHDNCASWAARTASEVMGKDISAQDVARLKDGTPYVVNGEPMKTPDCPRGLSKSIANLEREKNGRDGVTEKTPESEEKKAPEKKSLLHWNRSSSREENKAESQSPAHSGSKLYWNRPNPDRENDGRSR